MAAAMYAPQAVVAVEIQDDLAALIKTNAALNHLAVEAIAADIRARKIAELGVANFDLVMVNPPYRATHSGRRSPVAGRDLARAESAATLRDFVVASARYLKHGGAAAFVFAAARAADLISELRTHHLEPKRMRMVHPQLEMPATTVLIEARKGAGVELEVAPPLILYASKGAYSDEARRILEMPAAM